MQAGAGNKAGGGVAGGVCVGAEECARLVQELAEQAEAARARVALLLGARQGCRSLRVNLQRRRQRCRRG